MFAKIRHALNPSSTKKRILERKNQHFKTEVVCNAKVVLMLIAKCVNCCANAFIKVHVQSKWWW